MQHRSLLLRSLILISSHRTVKVRFISCVFSELCYPELHMRSCSFLQFNFYVLPVTEMVKKKKKILAAASNMRIWPSLTSCQIFGECGKNGSTSISVCPFSYAVDDHVFCCVTPLVGGHQYFILNYQWFFKKNR